MKLRSPITHLQITPEYSAMEDKQLMDIIVIGVMVPG